MWNYLVVKATESGPKRWVWEGWTRDDVSIPAGSGSLEEVCRTLGQQDWELVSVTNHQLNPETLDNSQIYTFFFKKPQ